MEHYFENLRIQYEENIAKVELNSPPVNALTPQVIEDLNSAVMILENLSDLRAVVVCSSHPKVFSAGADIKQFLGWTAEIGRESCLKGSKIFQRLAELPAAVICAINGGAYGGGMELALACDIRVAERTAKLALPECGLGVFPGYGGTQRLARLVGAGNAKRILFTADAVTGEDAYRMGLVEYITEPGDCVETAMTLAKKISSRAPLAVAGAKRMVDYSVSHDLEAGLSIENAQVGILFGTKDKDEGARAFVEKRSPVFDRA